MKRTFEPLPAGVGAAPQVTFRDVMDYVINYGFRDMTARSRSLDPISENANRA